MSISNKWVKQSTFTELKSVLCSFFVSLLSQAACNRIFKQSWATNAGEGWQLKQLMFLWRRAYGHQELRKPQPVEARNGTGSRQACSPQRPYISGAGRISKACGFLSATVSAALLGSESPQGRVSGMETQTRPPWRNARRSPGLFGW